MSDGDFTTIPEDYLEQNPAAKEFLEKEGFKIENNENGIVISWEKE